jgi:4'-phosphopantetheinyl transferase
MRVYWLEQTETDVPADNHWLSAAEIERLSTLRFAKRRADWQLGRWTAKQAIAACLNWPSHNRILAKIEIRATPSGAPEAVVPNLATPVAISLSHRAGLAICAVAPFGVKLGCDLEVIEPRSDAFLVDYFAPEEQSRLARVSAAEQPTLATLHWSAKESALKALGEGLRLDTRSVIASPNAGAADLSGWSPLRICHVGGAIFHGWWRTAEGMVYTVVAEPRPDSPIDLKLDEGLRRAEQRVEFRMEGHASTAVFSTTGR